MFRNNELFVGWEKTMHQKDIEKFAFLYLCGQRDRDILAGKERMTFEDFDRLSYITDFLGLDQMNLEIWNRFSLQFSGQFEALERLLKEDCRDMECQVYEDDLQLCDRRLMQFCADAPDQETQEYLRKVMNLLTGERDEERAGQAEDAIIENSEKLCIIKE